MGFHHAHALALTRHILHLHIWDCVSHTICLYVYIYINMYRIQTKENYIEVKREFLVLHSLIYSPRFLQVFIFLFFLLSLSLFQAFSFYWYVLLLIVILFRFTFQKKSHKNVVSSSLLLFRSIYSDISFQLLFVSVFFLLLHKRRADSEIETRDLITVALL